MSIEKSLEQRLAEGKEIKETISRHQIAFAFIKPDFVHLLPQIEEILKENNLEIIYKDKIRLQEDAIEYMYKDSLNDHFYPVMKRYLLNNDVMVMLVTGNYDDPQKILLSLKTKDGKDGIIREKFQKKLELSPEEIELWKKEKHPHQEEASILLTQQNVIHTAENAEEAVESLKKIIGPKFEEMEKRGNLPAELWGIFKDDKNATVATVDAPITHEQLEKELGTAKTVENIEVEGEKKEEEKAEQKEEKKEASEQDNSHKT